MQDFDFDRFGNSELAVRSSDLNGVGSFITQLGLPASILIKRFGESIGDGIIIRIFANRLEFDGFALNKGYGLNAVKKVFADIDETTA